MGGHLSPVLAGIFMEDFQEKALFLLHALPLLYKRYVDDILIIWDLLKGPYTVLLDVMNGLHLNIALTPEEELHGALPFLDLLIQ